MSQSPEIAHLVAFLQQDFIDAELAEDTLAVRDREIGRQLLDVADFPLSQIERWTLAVASPAVARAQAGVRGTTAALVIVGLVLGASAAGAAFRYTGEHPVNVVHILGVFVLLQMLLLLLWGLAALPSSASARIPGVLAIQDLLAMLNPGKLRRLLSNRLAPDYAAAMQSAAVRGHAHLRLYAELERNVALHASQVLAVAFNIAVVATALILVASTDLAFAWSTTLEVAPEEFHRISSFLATPWAWFWEDAVPSATLIHDSAYYRFQGGELAATASDLGEWWRFLIAAIVTYGLLPRVLTLLVSSRRLRRSVAHTLEAHPSTPHLLSRLNHALISTQAAGPDDDADSAAANSAIANSATLSGKVAAINWANSELAESAIVDALDALDLAMICCLQAGGSDLAGDEAAIAEVAKLYGDAVLLVKAWEPPMADVLDFLGDLREALGERSIFVLALGENAQSAEADHLRIWQQRCAGLGDEKLMVRSL